MFDQLRFDYLSCAGHPYLETPNIDWLAQQGVRFNRAYVQSPICGASRMSFYTGRYVHSHGAAWNNYPLRVGEQTLGDHLREAGMDAWLVGKTHMRADDAGLDRLGISRDGIIGARISECGFDTYIRDDGLWAEGPDGFYDARRSPYNDYLKAQGYTAENPWQDNANAGVDDEGNIASGWLMQNAAIPANIREEDSETPWLTSRAIDFITSRDDEKPWLAHVSYIKPHWPYIVPAPYHAMFGRNQILPPVRATSEQTTLNPVFRAFQDNVNGQAFARDDVRNAVIPAYMGLIKQCDDQMGRLFDFLRETDRLKDTMIVVTSDHGDYLGDHWLGEKELFHDCSVKIPLIIYDPSSRADTSRGTVCDELVESLDLTATFIEAAGGSVPDHIVEGRSLLPFLHSQPPAVWRDYVVSEYDYSQTQAAKKLGLGSPDARLFMIADKRWKFVHSEHPDHPPMLFDMETDPDELIDLGCDPDYRPICDKMMLRLGQWARRQSQRTSISDEEIAKAQSGKRDGIIFGACDGSELSPEELAFLTGPAQRVDAGSDGETS